MWHEMIIASLAILLILVHVRSVFVICVTLPLSVLFSFLLMWLLRQTGIIDIQANIMSLAGITISIGILVDQAIVMTENATHHLKRNVGDRKVTGDISELVVQPCRTVGRPIFFSVMIMLLSFIPVFMLSGREGKLFHPLAFTKSFAMVGVAIISVTLVPALIPTFLKGRLRSEEENWIVRSFINIYKPLLTWALPRRNLVMWLFSVLLILAAGIFPLQALLGMGASQDLPAKDYQWSSFFEHLMQFMMGTASAAVAWQICFFLTFALVASLTVIFTRGRLWQFLSLASLVLIALWAYHFQKIGVAFMPALDEGTTLDMPITIPRASVTQAADDLKARDALLRGFPEVESVIGKAGRADTPTDPAPLDMVETFVNYRPKELWPKRVLRYDDAAIQTGRVLDRLQQEGFISESMKLAARDSLTIDASQRALARFDETMRELALLRYIEFEEELQSLLTRFVVQEQVQLLKQAGGLSWPSDKNEQKEIEAIASVLSPKYGRWLARSPALEDVRNLSQDVATRLVELGAVKDTTTALELKESALKGLSNGVAELFGNKRNTLASELLRDLEAKRTELWRERIQGINWELFDRGIESFSWYAIEELVQGAEESGYLSSAPRGKEAARFAEQATKAQLGQGFNADAFKPFYELREELEKPFRRSVFFWPRKTGPKGDLVDDEMGRVLQVPGWSNIFTQPIINRIEMLSTGVRTDIGVKVFGPDLDSIDRVCKEIEAALKPINGARDVVAAPIMGKGYVQIDIDRQRAARYGISVENIQNEIEVALAGRAVTFTVENRERFPVRVRYARANRNDEESIQRLLIGAGSTSSSADANSSTGMAPVAAAAAMNNNVAINSVGPHTAAPAHAAKANPLIPLSAMADVRIVEGPAMIKSENGRLLNYVTLNVRGRDIVGFVDEALRVVAQKVELPEGVHLEWSGEFEHQVRAAKTLRIVFPAVIVLIFVILYLTYNDLADAGLMMLAVPEALAGGAGFMFFFPKIMQWSWDAPPMDFSVAVWVGFIACFGMATETGIIMLVYLREAIEKRGGLEKIQSLEELRQAVIEGAVHRLRPKLLTEGVAIIAIFPMVFATGVGGEILAAMALPVLGGLLISDEVVDLFLPVRFYWVRRARWLKLHRQRLASQNTTPRPAIALQSSTA
jgi:Cu(I)/Ag(I) efflux system membrane protein CusA/SilA